MGFKTSEVADLLVRCHRRCCICHRFCGTKIETDHIEPRAESEDDSIDNAIPVCLECHAEIHSYNDKHPRGRKFKPEELRQHKSQWLRICKERPEAMLASAWDRDVGPLEALIDELEFNNTIVAWSDEDHRGALFLNTQFLRAIQEGMIAALNADLKESILDAYVNMSRANQHISAEASQSTKERFEGHHAIKARDSIKECIPLIRSAMKSLETFLRHDRTSPV